jgi:hypothetical protein
MSVQKLGLALQYIQGSQAVPQLNLQLRGKAIQHQPASDIVCQ